MSDEKEVSPLFVRIPTADAERLSRASFELGKPKQEIVAEALRTLGSTKQPVGFASARNELLGEVLTTSQLAELLQVEEAVLRDLAQQGDLPGRKVGQDWRFSRTAILAWLAGE